MIEHLRRSVAGLGDFFLNSVHFISADALGRAAGLVVLPVLTRQLSSEAMGQLAIVSLVAGLMSTLLALGLGGSALRMHFNLPYAERADLHTTLVRFTALTGGTVALLSLLLALTPLGDVRILDVPYNPLLMLGLLSASASVALTLVPSLVLRAEGRASALLRGSTASAVVLVGGTVVLVVTLGLGVAGAIGARIAGSVALGAVTLIAIRDFLGGRFRPALLASALRYGILLLPHFFAHWALSGIDRFFIADELGLGEAGIYHVVYQLTGVMLVIVFAGGHALMPLIGSTVDSEPGDSAANRAAVATNWYVFGILTVGIAGIAGRFELLDLVAGEEYVVGADLVPWIALGFALVALYSPAVNVVNLVAGKAFVIGLITVGAAIVNVTGNVFLIPWLGLEGAAVATALSYATMFAGFALAARGRSAIPFQVRRLLGVLALAVAAGTSLSLLGIDDLMIRVGIAAVSIAAMASMTIRAPRELSQLSEKSED